MSLSVKARAILNKFSQTAVSLKDPNAVYPEPNQLPLGDVIEGLSQAAVDVASFSGVGADVGVHKTSLSLPAGSIITRIWTDTLVALDSSGAATVEIAAVTAANVSTSLVAAQDFGDFSGAKAEALAAPVKLSADSKISLVVAVEDLSDGSLKVFVEYLKPAIVPYSL